MTSEENESTRRVVVNLHRGQLSDCQGRQLLSNQMRVGRVVLVISTSEERY